MNIEELEAGLKEKGLGDEEIKSELLKIKTDIDNFLNPSAAENNEKKEKEESDEDKEHRIFGL